jgi:hypothetical protein
MKDLTEYDRLVIADALDKEVASVQKYLRMMRDRGISDRALSASDRWLERALMLRDHFKGS